MSNTPPSAPSVVPDYFALLPPFWVFFVSQVVFSLLSCVWNACEWYISNRKNTHSPLQETTEKDDDTENEYVDEHPRLLSVVREGAFEPCFKYLFVFAIFHIAHLLYLFIRISSSSIHTSLFFKFQAVFLGWSNSGTCILFFNTTSNMLQRIFRSHRDRSHQAKELYTQKMHQEEQENRFWWRRSPSKQEENEDVTTVPPPPPLPVELQKLGDTVLVAITLDLDETAKLENQQLENGRRNSFHEKNSDSDSVEKNLEGTQEDENLSINGTANPKEEEDNSPLSPPDQLIQPPSLPVQAVSEVSHELSTVENGGEHDTSPESQVDAETQKQRKADEEAVLKSTPGGETETPTEKRKTKLEREGEKFRNEFFIAFIIGIIYLPGLLLFTLPGFVTYCWIFAPIGGLSGCLNSTWQPKDARLLYFKRCIVVPVATAVNCAAIHYSILLYHGERYMSVPGLDWNSRDTHTFLTAMFADTPGILETLSWL